MINNERERPARFERADEGVCFAGYSLVCGASGNDGKAQVIGKQVLRSGTSVGAHYREAQRAKSDADFINKIEGGLQEAEETAYWLELLGESEIVPEARLKPLRNETEELIAILVTIVKNVKSRINEQKKGSQHS